VGITLQDLGRYTEALGAYEQSLETYRQLRDSYSISTALHHLGTVNRMLERFDVAEAYIQEALDLKRELTDRRGLANVLVSLAKLRINQGRWPEVRGLANEAAHLAQETQTDSLVVSAYALLGTVEILQDGDVEAGATHYAQSVLTAWEHHRVTGQNINHFVLHQLRGLVRLGKAEMVRAVCERILSTVRERVGTQYPEAVTAFEKLVSESSRSPGSDGA
jgi:tetratricopeptide (TPR) repeat protein